MNAELPELLTVKEVAKLLRCAVQTVTRHCQAGRLEYYDLNLGQKKHADYRFSRDMVLRFLEKGNAVQTKNRVTPRYVSEV